MMVDGKGLDVIIDKNNLEKEFTDLQENILQMRMEIKEIKDTDTSVFTQPHEFARHFDKLSALNIMICKLEAQIKEVTRHRSARLSGMRDVLLHYREVLDDAEQKAKSKMLFIQVSFLLIYFLFLSVGSFYGLFEAHRSYSIFVFICGLFGFLIFKNRKVGSLKDTLDQQLEKIDQAIREMNTLKDKAEWVAGQKND